MEKQPGHICQNCGKIVETKTENQTIIFRNNKMNILVITTHCQNCKCDYLLELKKQIKQP